MRPPPRLFSWWVARKKGDREARGQVSKKKGGEKEKECNISNTTADQSRPRDLEGRGLEHGEATIQVFAEQKNLRKTFLIPKETCS